MTSPVHGLDFEVTATTHANHFDFVVFDTRTGRDVHIGGDTTRERATMAAVRFIAQATPSAMLVLRNRAGFLTWSRDAQAWFPLPLMPEADIETARAVAASLPAAAGRTVHVITA